MDDLIAFVRARLDEDEAAAKAATSGPWMTREGREHLADNVVYGQSDWSGHIQQACNTDYSQRQLADAAHISRHDPARVLREVEAKRKILAEYERTAPQGLLWDQGYAAGLACAVKCIAAVWSDHPDYPR